MLEREVKVVEAKDGKVCVEAYRTSACSSCGVTNSCGTSVLGKWMEKKTRIYLENTHGLAEGDKVIIGVGENEFIQASFAVYLFPLITMLITALLVSSYTENQGMIAISGLSGLFAGFFLLSRKRKDRQCPIVLLGRKQI